MRSLSLFPLRCTKCNSSPINGQCTNFILLNVALLHVCTIKGENNWLVMNSLWQVFSIRPFSIHFSKLTVTKDSPNCCRWMRQFTLEMQQNRPAFLSAELCPDQLWEVTTLPRHPSWIFGVGRKGRGNGKVRAGEGKWKWGKGSLATSNENLRPSMTAVSREEVASYVCNSRSRDCGTAGT